MSLSVVIETEKLRVVYQPILKGLDVEVVSYQVKVHTLELSYFRCNLSECVIDRSQRSLNLFEFFIQPCSLRLGESRG